MVLTGTGVLNAKDFKAGDMLNTTGTIQGTVKSPGGVHDIAVYIPANNCQTLMAAARQVTLSFDANGGTGAVPEAMSAYVNNAGLAEFSIPDAKLSRDGYVFKGWSENQEGVARYQAKDTLTIGSDTVLYAVWERMFTVTYTVTGDIPDGYKAPESTMVA